MLENLKLSLKLLESTCAIPYSLTLHENLVTEKTNRIGGVEGGALSQSGLLFHKKQNRFELNRTPLSQGLCVAIQSFL